MNEVKRYYGVSGRGMVYASDYDALMVERDELLRVVEWMVNYTAADHDEVPLIDNDRLFDAGQAIIAKCRGDL